MRNRNNYQQNNNKLEKIWRVHYKEEEKQMRDKD